MAISAHKVFNRVPLLVPIATISLLHDTSLILCMITNIEIEYINSMLIVKLSYISIFAFLDAWSCWSATV